MKKTYMQPAAQVMIISGRDAMMAETSIGIYKNTEVDTSVSGVQLGREEEGLGGAWDTEW